MAETIQPRATTSAFVWRDRYALYFALLVAWVAMLGSLYFSEVRHLSPCRFCWFQRILMYPMALAILPIGLLRRDEETPIYTLFLSVLGMGLAMYHYLLQKTTWFAGGGSCDPANPCSTIDFQLWGFVTIPFMALVAFTLIFFASLWVLLARTTLWDDEEAAGRAPWLPVAGIVGAVLLGFAPSFFNAPPPPAEAATSPAPAESLVLGPSGAERYREACAGCHGLNGEGAVGAGPALVGADSTTALSDEEWVALVRAGIPADHPDNVTGLTMPPSGGRPDLTDADLQAILSFLRLQSGDE